MNITQRWRPEITEVRAFRIAGVSRFGVGEFTLHDLDGNQHAVVSRQWVVDRGGVNMEIGFDPVRLVGGYFVLTADGVQNWVEAEWFRKNHIAIGEPD